MRYIEIPGVKLPVSQLVMGSDYFSPDRYALVSEMLDAFVAIGGTTIDSAYIYMGGQSEKAIGMWVKERSNRDKINLWTKGAHHNEHGPRVKKEYIDEELKVSLDRLQTDYVDMYALHRDDPNIPVGHIIEALNEHVEAGRIRSFGGSNWSQQRLQEANDYAKAHGLVGFSFNSPNLSLARPNEPRWFGCISADEAMREWHRETQMPLLSWSSQAGGFFSGRFSPDKQDDSEMVRVYYSDDNWERYNRTNQLAEEKGVSPIQISLAFVLNQAFPACALIGARTQEELQSCAVGAEIVLSEVEMAWLDLKADSK